jgi:hypothetical protein
LQCEPVVVPEALPVEAPDPVVVPEEAAPVE